MRGSQADLVRLANDELAPLEAWAAFTAFADAVQELHTAVGGFADAAGSI